MILIPKTTIAAPCERPDADSLATGQHHCGTGNFRLRPGRAAGFLACLLLALANLVSAAPHGNGNAHVPLLPQPSGDIACDETPFGRKLLLGRDDEFVEVRGYGGISYTDSFHEWTLPPDPDAPDSPAYIASIDSDWSAGTDFAGATLLAAVDADLDGDGQDEIVVAAVLYVPSFGIGLGVLERQPEGAASPLALIDTWRGPSVDSLDPVGLIAGDFDGSQDGRDELALKIRSNDDDITVLILSGDADTGGIAQGDSEVAGSWNWHPQVGEFVGQNSFAAGPMVLDGKDQIIVVTEIRPNGGQQRTIKYHLLEYQPADPLLWPILDNNQIGRRYYFSVIGDEFAYGDNGSQGTTISGIGITRIDVDVGDLVGDAASELVTEYEFETLGDLFVRHLRLQHFITTRSPGGTITDIQLARAEDDTDFDDGIKLDESNYRSGWDAVVRNIDDQPKAEIVFVRNSFAGDSSSLDAQIHKASYQLTASFSWYRGGRDVQFTDESVGYGEGPFNPQWDFGDGGTSNTTNPSHRFLEREDPYHVTLSIQEGQGADVSTSTYEAWISVDADSTARGEGIDPDTLRFRIRREPIYESHYPIENAEHNAERLEPIHVAIGDMDRDGFGEIMAVSRQGTGTSGSGDGLLRSRWRLQPNPSPPHDFTGSHLFQQADTLPPMTYLEGMAAVAADFDGDSVQATIAADCRTIVEGQVRQMVWSPPYFARLQSGSTHSASFGRSTTGGSGQTRQFGTFTSHDVSGYVGTGLGFDFLGLLGVEASIKATAGQYEQTANGGLVGTENDFSLTQGMESALEGLLIYETNTFNCYTYEVSQASIGIDPDSSLRLCEIQNKRTNGTDLTFLSGADPDFWDREYPRDWAAGSEGHPPPYWVPMTRDWANLALFRPIRTNSSFESGTDGEFLTDGMFTTTTTSQPRAQPFVEIDLGSVEPITNIRVFAPRGELASELAGFRVYTSNSPMPETGLPSGVGVHEFSPDSLNGAVYDRWNIRTRAWNNDTPGVLPGDPLRARYIRLQHPGEAVIDVGEIQVFGEPHNEPPAYPEAVCDPISDDGLFLAKIWSPLPSPGFFREIEIRGDMLWNGTGPTDHTQTWGADGLYLHGCENNGALTGDNNNSNFDALLTGAIGGTADQTWSFSQSSINSIGTTTSFEGSTRVGAEFDLSLTAFVSLTAGGAEEFESGVTEDNQTVNYWGTGIDIGGAIGGFQPVDSEILSNCQYGARPYAYRLDERSDTGYRHSVYAVDYVVPETGSTGGGSTVWHRGEVPALCLPDDRIFQSGFDGP